MYDINDAKEPSDLVCILTGLLFFGLLGYGLVHWVPSAPDVDTLKARLIAQ